MTGIDARAYLLQWLQGLVGMYSADVNAIPEEKWTVGFGGCTRPGNELTADTIALLAWSTQAIKGETPSGDYQEAMTQLKQKCGTREGAVAELKSASEEFASALGSASEETLSKTIQTPWGMESPVFSIAQVAVSHIWYHDGQLNYIQCLLGDDKVHWMG
jgi:hypothetical protein